MYTFLGKSTISFLIVVRILPHLSKHSFKHVFASQFFERLINTDISIFFFVNTEKAIHHRITNGTA